MTTEDRLSALEGQVAALAAQADQLRERHALLEGQMIKGLSDLQAALDAINARRPPVRRKLEELEQRLDIVAPPNGEQPPSQGEPVGEEEAS